MDKLFCKIVDNVEEFFLKIFEKIGLKVFTNFYREHKEGMRYLVFGGLSTIVNILIFAICQRGAGLSTEISNTIAWIAAVIFAYITNKLCVFDAKSDGKKDLIKEISSFFGARIFTLVLETIFLKITIDYLNYHSLIMKIISNILVVILNFVFSKLFIFKKIEKEERN